MYRNYYCVESTIKINEDIDIEEAATEFKKWMHDCCGNNLGSEIFIKNSGCLIMDEEITRTMLAGIVAAIQKCVKNKQDKFKCPYLTFRVPDESLFDDPVEFRIYFTVDGPKVVYADFSPIYSEDAHWFDFRKEDF